ncbi:MAG: DUF448 domain-containing protein [Candidatus Methylomirabilales bacterium]
MMEGRMSSGGAKSPERTCVGCGQRRGQRELLRFSGGPAGLQVHLEGGAGRGAYCCPDAGCLERTVQRKALQRALGADLDPLSVQGLRAGIHRAVLRKVHRLLGLARRAKRIVAGPRAVAAALATGRVRLLLFHHDVFPQGDKRLAEEAERRGVPVVRVFSRDDLEGAIGAPSPGAVALLDGSFAEGILRTSRYWIPFMSEERPLGTGEERQRGGGWRG